MLHCIPQILNPDGLFISLVQKGECTDVEKLWTVHNMWLQILSFQMENHLLNIFTTGWDTDFLQTVILFCIKNMSDLKNMAKNWFENFHKLIMKLMSFHFLQALLPLFKTEISKWNLQIDFSALIQTLSLLYEIRFRGINHWGGGNYLYLSCIAYIFNRGVDASEVDLLKEALFKPSNIINYLLTREVFPTATSPITIVLHTFILAISMRKLKNTVIY